MSDSLNFASKILSWSSRKNFATNAVRNRLSKTVQTVRATTNTNESLAVLVFFSDRAQKRGVQGNRCSACPRTPLRPGVRSFGISHQTAPIGLKKAKWLSDIVTTLLPAKKTDVLELDECGLLCIQRPTNDGFV